MITTDRIAAYAERNRQYLNERRSAISQITDAEVQAARGNDGTISSPTCDPKPILFEFYSQDPEMFYNEVGFSIDEFEHLYALSAGCFIPKGRGRKANIAQKDILVLLLHYFRRYPRLEEMSAALGMTTTQLSKIIDHAVHAAHERYVPLLINRPAEVMDLPLDPNVPECGYIVDATVQRILVPTGTFDQKKGMVFWKAWFLLLKEPSNN